MLSATAVVAVTDDWWMVLCQYCY